MGRRGEGKAPWEGMAAAGHQSGSCLGKQGSALQGSAPLQFGTGQKSEHWNRGPAGPGPELRVCQVLGILVQCKFRAALMEKEKEVSYDSASQILMCSRIPSGSC